MIFRLLALCLLIESLFMLLPLTYGLFAGEDIMPFVYSIGISVAASLPFLLIFKPYSKVLYARDGWFTAGIIWVVISLFGTMPFYFSGLSKSFIDCFFETVSGFTTTGATLLTNIEAHSDSILMWRSLTNWVGGMGVLVLLLAILPGTESDMRALHLMRAEAPGPNASKLVPKMGQTAKILYILYFALTMATFIALILAGMPLFDALLHSWSASATGGFSPKNTSVAHYGSTAVNIIISVSMLLSSINFMVFFNLVMRQFKSVFKNSELLFHLSMLVICTITVTFNIRNLFPSFGHSIENAFFQVSSIMTTTGFSSGNYNSWPNLSKNILLILMVFGGCAGSTSGGLKTVRAVILLKAARREINRLTHSRIVRPIKVDTKAIDDAKVSAVIYFFLIYAIAIVLCMIILSLDGFDLETTFSAAIATFSNVGPGFGRIGATGNFSEFSQLSKVVLSFGMLLGRLEFFPIIILFVPSTFKLHGQEIAGVSKRFVKRIKG